MDPAAFEKILENKYPQINAEHLESAKSLNTRFSAVDDFDALQAKLINDQEALSKQAHIRTGNLLYAIAAVQTHLDATPDKTQPELDAFSKSLDASYQNIANPSGMKERLKKLLVTGNTWLNSFEGDVSDDTKVLCQSLYTVLTMLGNDVEAARKTWSGKAAFRIAGINADEIIGEIKGNDEAGVRGMLPQLEDTLTSAPQQNEPPTLAFLEEDEKKLDIMLDKLSDLIEARKKEKALGQVFRDAQKTWKADGQADEEKVLSEVAFRAAVVQLRQQVVHVKAAKAAFTKSAQFKGEVEPKSVLNVNIEMLENLHADTVVLKNTLEKANKAFSELKEPELKENKGGIGRCIARMRKQCKNWFGKSSKERQEANQAVKQESEGFFAWFKKKINQANLDFGKYTYTYAEVLRKAKARGKPTEKAENAENKNPNTRTDSGPSQ